jgi:hypothetical protein
MNKLLIRRVSLLTFCLGVAALNGWSAPVAKTIGAQAAFEQLKQLAGEWRGATRESDKTTEVRAVYRVTASGSALIETLFPGSPHEMVTVYHLDGDKLVLTHYCAAGNQPRMTLSRKSTPQELEFAFSGATNLKSAKAGHMHDLRLRFESANQISAEWDYFENGKKKETTRFTLNRQPSA